MKKLILIIASSLGLILINSCGLADERESIVHDYFQQKVISDSQGAVKLETFTKTNGYEQDVMGMKMYVLEWQADILTQKEIWKKGDLLSGYWQSFVVMTKKPEFWDAYVAGGFAKYFGADAKIRLRGESNLKKTEQGWRVEALRIKTSQVLSEGSASNISSNSTSNSYANSTPTEEKVTIDQSDANAKSILQGMWYGTIGKKQFTLNLETVGGGQVSGYDIAGTNQRPVKGTYSFYRGGGACTLTLKEPGDDKWDGTFAIEMDVLSDEWGGGGTWKAFNGQLSNHVSFSRRPPDNPSDFVAPTNSSNSADKLIGIWTNTAKDELKISKSGANYKVTYHPYQDYIFDLVGYNLNGVIKCPHGQDNMDTTVISLVTDSKVKFVGEWDNGTTPGSEIYYFTK